MFCVFREKGRVLSARMGRSNWSWRSSCRTRRLQRLRAFFLCFQRWKELISCDGRHNISAYRITKDGLSLQDNDDDGENAAGSRLAHLLTLLVRSICRGSSGRAS